MRGEEDKPLPVTYMRPARKKMRELANMRDRHITLVSHDRPSITELVLAPPVDDLCVTMVTGDKKPLEMEVVPVDVAKTSSVEAVAPVCVKVEVCGGQSLLTDGQLKIPLAMSPPPQSKLKLKLKRSNSPPVIEFKNQGVKVNSFCHLVNQRALLTQLSHGMEKFPRFTFTPTFSSAFTFTSICSISLCFIY